jgi:Fic family protein
MNNKIDLPILCLSKYIMQNRKEYYNLLNECNNDIKRMEDFIIYILKAVEEASVFTINFINKINESYRMTCEQMSNKLPKIYRKEIVDSIYFEFYTKNVYFQKYLNLSRTTSTTYLKLLVKEGFLVEEKIGKEVIYKNVVLFNLIENL